MKRTLPLLALSLTGCGPDHQELANTALVGAVGLALVAWLVTWAVASSAYRLRFQAPPERSLGRGLGWLLPPFAAISVAAWHAGLPVARAEVAFLIWVCAGFFMIGCALLVHLLSGWGAAGSTLVGGLLALAPGAAVVLGWRGAESLMYFLWIWGSLFGTGTVVVVVLLVARLRRA